MNPTSAVASDVCSPVASHAIGQEAASAIAATLKGLSDPLRLRMLSAIASDPRGESCVCDLAELADVSQPTVSHHLKVLRDVGVVRAERRGTWVWYRISPGRRAAVATLLDSFAPATAAPEDEVGGASERPDFDTQVTELGLELAAETPALAGETVLSIVRESYTALARTVSATGALVALTERFARQRIADLVRDRDASVPQVLFVCVANAGRSQLAAALVDQLAGGRITARSAGSSPAGAVHSNVRSLLQELEGEAAAARFPKPLTDDAVRAADVIVTMGCGDVCPTIPGIRYEDWAVGDPALASPAGVAAIRDHLAARVRVLVDDLLTGQPQESS